jgi:hypothetical protein
VDFVYIYGQHLWKVPYFVAYATAAEWLARIMVLSEPGRKAALIAAEAAMAKLVPAKYLNVKKINDDMAKHRAAGLPVPAIAEDL